MIILPTKNRPQNLKRFIHAYRTTEATEKVCLIINADDLSYLDVSLPPSFFIERAEATAARPGLGLLINEVFNKYPDEEYYALMADDVVPETLHWDRILKDACLRCKGIAWGNDGIAGKRLSTHPFIYGNLVRQLGWICYPKLNHCYIDTCIHLMGKAFGRKYFKEVKTTHYHPQAGKAALDDVYLNQPDAKVDKLIWQSDEKYLRKLFKSLKRSVH
jgi:hypothetical protein